MQFKKKMNTYKTLAVTVESESWEILSGKRWAPWPYLASNEKNIRNKIENIKSKLTYLKSKRVSIIERATQKVPHCQKHCQKNGFPVQKHVQWISLARFPVHATTWIFLSDWIFGGASRGPYETHIVNLQT